MCENVCSCSYPMLLMKQYKNEHNYGKPLSIIARFFLLFYIFLVVRSGSVGVEATPPSSFSVFKLVLRMETRQFHFGFW